MLPEKQARFDHVYERGQQFSGMRCRIVSTMERNRVRIQLENGVKLVTSRHSLRPI